MDVKSENQRRGAGTIRVGPAGWSYPDWAGIVYPARKPRGFHEAAYLAEYFDTIEINTSFYHPLRPEHCRQWIGRVSQNPRFLFTAKLWQKFTHESGAGADDERAVRAGLDVLHAAGKLGAVLLQFPFSFHRTPENTRHLNSLLKQFADYPLVVEVRHATWNDKAFYALLHERGVGFCNIDQPLIGRSIKPSERATSRVGYVRLHGRRYDSWFSGDPAMPPSERYNYLYTEEELGPWVKRIRHVADGGDSNFGGVQASPESFSLRVEPGLHPGGLQVEPGLDSGGLQIEPAPVFVITNNHFEGKALVNALQLVHLLTGAKVKVPDSLRQHYPQLERIGSEPPVEPLLFPK